MRGRRGAALVAWFAAAALGSFAWGYQCGGPLVAGGAGGVAHDGVRALAQPEAYVGETRDGGNPNMDYRPALLDDDDTGPWRTILRSGDDDRAGSRAGIRRACPVALALRQSRSVGRSISPTCSRNRMAQTGSERWLHDYTRRRVVFGVPICHPRWRCAPRRARRIEGTELTPTPIVTLSPAPTPTATPAPCDTRCVVDAIWTAGGYGWELSFMHAVVQCESGWDPNATGRLGEAGLFQIHPVNWWMFNGQDPWDVTANTEVALRIRKASGWSPWSCAR